jgi:DNA-binding IscR family transcriptional regulator
VQCVAEQRCTPCASENGCMTRGVWEEVRDRLVETLDSITLADLQLPRRDSAHEAADDSGDAEQQTGPTLATSAGPSPWRRIKE